LIMTISRRLDDTITSANRARLNVRSRLVGLTAGAFLNQRSDAPNAAEAVARYRDHAKGYDASARRTMWIRARTIEKLNLRTGDRVLDVACGTGLSIPFLREAVGDKGEVTGIEVSPEMLSLARQRVTEASWRNVTLLESSLESADICGPLDAILFHFTHDVMRSPAALKRIFAAAGPEARIAWLHPGISHCPTSRCSSGSRCCSAQATSAGVGFTKRRARHSSPTWPAESYRSDNSLLGNHPNSC
jgi:SAM-dependent methyltransferase